MASAEVLAGVDIVALRLGEAGRLELLLGRRAQEPFADQWALPGVLVNGRCADASLDAAAGRALQDRARIVPAHLEQVATVGNAARDPRGWSLSTFYLALLAPDVRLPGEDLRFVALEEVLYGRLSLPFDHAQLVAQAAERLAGKAVYTSLPLYLLAPCFTVTEALAAFQAVLGQTVQHTTLRGRLDKMKQHGWIADTGEKNQPKMGRPQHLLAHRPQAPGGFIFDRSVLS
ncbi:MULTISPECIES: NUDIX hydrolase [unclassified Pseudomonas]|uniref:NUDIX hydrolase n=1 Tax=unclassified Pseudomonas TaxID=196821 RepID=UPI00244B19BC|nr:MULTISPECIES: NUDIX hydrolase [unclassified Pseudomonas]MDH0895344.1 NUDIX hydrolase [Pseudomonas sp. GD03875]MDH1064138.1 NUDIX hydrolase [Pseudomonas sp. GD03985]